MNIEKLQEIVVVIPAYEPSKVFQGPINTTKKLIQVLLTNTKSNIKLITSNFIAPGKRIKSTQFGNIQKNDVRLMIEQHNTLFSYNTSAICPSAISAIAKNTLHSNCICVVGYYEFISLIGIICSRIWNKPTLWNTTGALIPELCKKKSRHKKKMLTCFYQLIVKPERLLFLAKSKEEASIIKETFSSSKVVLIPNSIPDWLKSDYCGDRIGLVKVVYAGRINRVKRIELLIEALYKLQDLPWHCVIAGVVQDNNYLCELECLIRNYGLEEKVRIELGLCHSRLQSLYNTTDIFVLPSISENFGMAALEATACGAFPVLSRRVGYGDYLMEIDNSILKVFSDVNELSAIISGLVKNIETIRKTTAYRKEIIRSYFNTKTEEDKLVKAFQYLSSI